MTRIGLTIFRVSAICSLIGAGCLGSAFGGVLPMDGRSETSPSTDRSSELLPLPSTPPVGDDFHPQGRGWDLVWSDEFSGDKLDATKWAPEESCWGGGNNERQCYTDRERNIQVVNGVLRLAAYPERHWGPLYPIERRRGSKEKRRQEYTSGKVRTRGLASWTYGRFEARIKLPKGQGTWPAFWMMPADDFYGRWAASGEIDIMESVNLGAACSDCEGSDRENRSVGALHYGGPIPKNTHVAGRMTLPGGPGGVDQYHVYAAEWGEGVIRWFVDGEQFMEMTADDWFSTSKKAEGRPGAPFDQPFYLMLNLAVGGAFPEGTNEKTFDPAAFPNELLIDWVRVYQCASDPETGRACMENAQDGTGK